MPHARSSQQERIRAGHSRPPTDPLNDYQQINVERASFCESALLSVPDWFIFGTAAVGPTIYQRSVILDVRLETDPWSWRALGYLGLMSEVEYSILLILLSSPNWFGEKMGAASLPAVALSRTTNGKPGKAASKGRLSKVGCGPQIWAHTLFLFYLASAQRSGLWGTLEPATEPTSRW